MNSKITFILTKQKNGECGVADFTNLFIKKLKTENYLIKKIEVKNWGIFEIFKLKKQLNYEDSLIVTYPTLNMGRSMALVFINLILKKKIIFNLHEFRIFSLYRKIIFFFLSFSNKFIFANYQDKKIFNNLYSWTTNNCYIMPIASNIENISSQKKSDKSGMMFFGNIRKNNNSLNQFLDLCKFIKLKTNMKLCVCGSFIDVRNKNYFIKYFQRLNINYFSELSSIELSKILNSYKIAYLPYPQGLTENKGTALACLDHGLALFTNFTLFTPQLLKNLTIDISDKSLHELSNEILKIEKSKKYNINKKYFEIYKQYYSWENIIKTFKNIISNLS